MFFSHGDRSAKFAIFFSQPTEEICNFFQRHIDKIHDFFFNGRLMKFSIFFFPRHIGEICDFFSFEQLTTFLIFFLHTIYDNHNYFLCLSYEIHNFICNRLANCAFFLNWCNSWFFPHDQLTAFTFFSMHDWQKSRLFSMPDLPNLRFYSRPVSKIWFWGILRKINLLAKVH